MKLLKMLADLRRILPDQPRCKPSRYPGKSHDKRGRFATAVLLVTFLSIHAAYAQSDGEFLNRFSSYLIDADGAPLAKSKIDQLDYIMVYFSASWCGPCHQFTPSLVEFYNSNHKEKKFEVVLLSLDRSESKMLKYMKQYQMPWSAVAFSKIDASGFLSTRYVRATDGKGSFGIPYLIVLDRDGKMILEPYLDDQYIGASGVLDGLKKMLN